MDPFTEALKIARDATPLEIRPAARAPEPMDQRYHPLDVFPCPHCGKPVRAELEQRHPSPILSDWRLAVGV